MLDINTLRQVPLFSQLTESRLYWLLEQGTAIRLQPGDIHRDEGDLADCVFVLLEGEVRVTQKIGNQEVLLATYTPQTLFGELPILMGQEHLWARGRAVKACYIFELEKPVFLELLSSCTCVMTAILRTMAERVQELQMISQNRERLVALGTLAAGLAHELNNPASANRRAVKQLRSKFQELQPLSLKFSQQSLTSSQQIFLCNLQEETVNRALTAPKLDPLMLSDQEDAVTDWLNNQAIDNSWKIAPTLVAAGLDTSWLNMVKTQVNQSLLSNILNWIAVTLSEVGLLEEIERSTARISTLVQAVKDYSYMDRAPLQVIDIHEGLESTITMLGHKLKREIKLIREYGCELPQINAYGSELNQVWTNLIDNAIDAFDENPNFENVPTIWIRTNCECDFLMVEIADNGVGIPLEKLSHIFEPFFTTKGVGKGTGLGLHIAYRIVVALHQGDIHVLSQPGDTRFQIRLPLSLPNSKVSI